MNEFPDIIQNKNYITGAAVFIIPNPIVPYQLEKQNYPSHRNPCFTNDGGTVVGRDLKWGGCHTLPMCKPKVDPLIPHILWSDQIVLKL